MITSKTLSQLNLNQGLKITDCEIKLMLTWSKNWVIWKADRGKTFAITSAKLCVPVETLSTQGNWQLLEKLKSGFKITIS